MKKNFKLLQIFNQYRSINSGEERVVFDIMNLMKDKGISARLLMRTSRGIEKSFLKKVHAFWNCIYSYSSYKDIIETIREFKPDIVHINNLYPLFSPSILVACNNEGIPVVMTVQNYALTCPTAHHLRKGQICERCIGGHEYWCVLKNCRENMSESVAYAVRSFTARKLKLFYKYVILFIVPTKFTENKLLESGFKKDKMVILRNMIKVKKFPINPFDGQYIAYAGRMSQEKGVNQIITAARNFKNINFHLAGDGPIKNQLVKDAPKNVKFVGLLNEDELDEFYRKARFLIVPSIWYEMCPLVISQAFSHGLPVLASNIGGLPELVEDGITGMLFNPGNLDDLNYKIKTLWDNPELCKQLGNIAYKKSTDELGENIYFDKLLNVYMRALNRYQKGIVY